MIQSYLVQADTIEELDEKLDEFLKDKEAKDIVSTDINVFVSPWKNNQPAYIAFVTYNGKPKRRRVEIEEEDEEEEIVLAPRPIEGKVTIVDNKSSFLDSVTSYLTNKYNWLFIGVWISIALIGYFIYRAIFKDITP